MENEQFSEAVHSGVSLALPSTHNRLSRGWVGLAAVGAIALIILLVIALVAALSASNLGWQGWLAIAVTLAAFLLNALTSLAAEVIFLGALVLLLLSGVLDTPTALAGFSNPGMITVAVLYIVVAGLQQTGGLDMVSRTVLGMTSVKRVVTA